MKKILLFAVVAMMSTSAFAQWSYGVKGGLNLASLTNHDQIYGDDAKMKAAYYFGAFAEYQINDFVAVSPELVFSSQGQAFKYDEAKGSMRLNYLNLPILAKISLIDKLTLDLGPQFGFLVNAAEMVKFDGEKFKESNTDDINKFDIGFAMGLTYDLGPCLVQARYNLGFTDVIKDNEFDDKFKNNVLQIGVGYRF